MQPGSVSKLLGRLARPLCVALLGGGAATHAADDAGLGRCLTIPDRLARYACYDSLPAPIGMPAPGSAAVTAADNFGLERQQQAAAISQGPSSVGSSIPGKFEGWHPNSQFKLANGQVWQVSDGSSASYLRESPKVTITRGFLGSFFMNVEGLNRAPKVRRVQ